MKFEVITSFDKKYYDLIGYKCVETFLDLWPENFKITVYTENFSLEKDERINQIDFEDLDKKYIEFQKSELGHRTKTFAKKAYSIIHSFENSKADRIIWLDADVITIKSIAQSFLEQLCPDNILTTFMGVTHKKMINEQYINFFSAETGFFIVNKQHNEFENFKNRYRFYYDNQYTLNLRRFYDGDVFGAVVKEFSESIYVDLANKLKKTYKTPLKHTEIGKYLVHYKAKHSKDSFKKFNSSNNSQCV